jgi:PncC family amidohydrolase
LEWRPSTDHQSGLNLTELARFVKLEKLSLNRLSERYNLVMQSTIPELELASLAGEWLRKRGLKLVTAESCTGGLIGDWITDVPGSSDYYLGGVVAYSYEAKTALLGVPTGLLAQFGAVSEETACEMARGARAMLGDAFPAEQVVALSVSGIAGPGGGQPSKPVGLVWIGLSGPGLERAYQYHFQADRIQNKRQFAREALQLLVGYLQGNLRGEV